MSKTIAERQHMDKVAQLPCVICSRMPVELHHAHTGGGGRRNHMKVLPLCFSHHRGEKGIHTMGRKAWAREFGSETEMLERVAGMI